MKKNYLLFLVLLITVSCGEEQYNLESETTPKETKWVQIVNTDWPLSIPTEGAKLSLFFQAEINSNFGIIQISTSQTEILLSPKITWINGTNCILQTEQLEPQQTYFLQLLNFIDINNQSLLNQNLQFMTTIATDTSGDLLVQQTYPTNNSSGIDNSQKKLTILFNKKTAATNFILRINDKFGIIPFTNVTATGDSSLQTFELTREIAPAAFLFGVITINNSTNKPYYFSFQTATNTSSQNSEEIYSLKISEIMIGKTGNNDSEFIELYNPSPFMIDIAKNNLRIYRASESGATSLVCSLNNNTHFINDYNPNYITIPPYGYYLLVNSNADLNLLDLADAVIKDSRFCLTDNNSIFITTGGSPSTPENIIDLIGYGSAKLAETESTANITTDMSIERKANEYSTFYTMRTGGYDNKRGNIFDSQNNKQDFIIRENPDPQNSRSASEIVQ